MNVCVCVCECVCVCVHVCAGGGGGGGVVCFWWGGGGGGEREGFQPKVIIPLHLSCLLGVLFSAGIHWSKS